jgi:hypothetical protein
LAGKQLALEKPQRLSVRVVQDKHEVRNGTQSAQRIQLMYLLLAHLALFAPLPAG